MAEYIVSSVSPVQLLVRVFDPSNGFLLGPYESVRIHGKKQYALLFRDHRKQALNTMDALQLVTGVPVCGYWNKREKVPQQVGDDSIVVFVWEQGNGYWNRIRKFSVFPHTTRPYRAILQDFYLSKPPRIDILPVSLEYIKPKDPFIVDEDWDSTNLKNRVFNFYGHDCDRMCGYRMESFRVRDHIRLEYETNLQLLWELPLLGLVSRYHAPLTSTSGFLVRFRSDDRVDHVLLSFKDISSWSRWLVRTSHLISDTLLILASLLGYHSITTNELMLLAIAWWVDALTKLSYNMTLSSCKYSSVLLVSDIMNRVESPAMFVKMINSFSRSPHIREWSSGIGSSEIYLGSESIFPRYAYVPLNLKQADFIRVWNLLRTQMGLPVVTTENYLEVTDVSSSPV